MKAIRLNARNFKNKRGNISFELTGKDLFTGPNGSGKSRALEIFRLSLTGSVPNVNQKDLWQLAIQDPSVNEFWVETEFDNGFKVRRTFKRSYDKKTQKPVVSQDIDVYPKRGEKTQNEKEARITKEIGSNLIGFDFAAFDSLSDAGQRDYLLSYFPVNFTQDDLMKVVMDVLKEKPEHKKFENEIVTDVLNNFPEKSDKSSLELLDFTFQNFSEKSNKLTQEAQANMKAAEKVSEISHERQEIAADLSRLKQAQTSTQEAIVRVNNEITAITGLMTRANELDEKIASYESRINRVTTTQEELEGLKVEKSELVKRINTANTSLPGLRKELEELEASSKILFNQGIEHQNHIRISGEIEAITASIKTLSDSIKPVTIESDSEALETASQKLHDGRERIQALANLKGQYKHILELINEVREGSGTHSGCPICQSNVKPTAFDQSYQHNQAEIDRIDAELEAMTPEVENLAFDYDQAKEKVDGIKTQITLNQQYLKQIEQKEEELLAKREVLKINASYPTAKDEYDKISKSIREKKPIVTNTEKQISDDTARIQAIDKILETVSSIENDRAVLTQLKSDRGLIVFDAEKVVILKGELAQHQAKLQSTQAKIQERTELDRDRALEATTLSSSADINLKAVAFKDVCKAIGPKGFKGELLKRELNPFIAEVNRIITEAKIGEEYTFTIQMIDARENEVFRPAFLKSGNFISFKTINTGHRLMLISAFIGALHKDAEYSAVILDNLEVIDDENEKIAVRIMEKLKVDNLLVASSRGNWYSQTLEKHLLMPEEVLILEPEEIEA